MYIAMTVASEIPCARMPRSSSCGRKSTVIASLFGRPFADPEADALVGLVRGERQVDVPDRHVDVPVAPDGVVDDHLLVAHAEAELLGERRGHDDERQAVARPDANASAALRVTDES